MNLVTYAVPFFVLAIALELAYGILRKRNTYRLNDSIGSLFMGLLSTTTTLNLPGGTPVLDGDVFLWNGTGQIDVQYPESLFESITGTSAVDVDAFTIDPSGTLYFSFADDETTTAPTLIAENGGMPSPAQGYERQPREVRR